MATLTVPNAFVTGTTIQAAPFNANFAAVAASVNSVDNTQIGPAGIFASQILPLTTAQATFAGSVGYVFPGTLTVNGTTLTVDAMEIMVAAGGTNFIPASAGQPFQFTNAANTQNNFKILDAGGVQATTSGSSTLSYLPPVYTAAGAAVASTAHIVTGTFTGTGGSVTVTFSGAAAFSSNTSYLGIYVDLFLGTVIGFEPGSGSSAITGQNTAPGDHYYYIFIGT